MKYSKKTHKRQKKHTKRHTKIRGGVGTPIKDSLDFIIMLMDDAIYEYETERNKPKNPGLLYEYINDTINEFLFIMSNPGNYKLEKVMSKIISYIGFDKIKLLIDNHLIIEKDQHNKFLKKKRNTPNTNYGHSDYIMECNEEITNQIKNIKNMIKKEYDSNLIDKEHKKLSVLFKSTYDIYQYLIDVKLILQEILNEKTYGNVEYFNFLDDKKMKNSEKNDNLPPISTSTNKNTTLKKPTIFATINNNNTNTTKSPPPIPASTKKNTTKKSPPPPIPQQLNQQPPPIPQQLNNQPPPPIPAFTKKNTTKKSPPPPIPQQLNQQPLPIPQQLNNQPLPPISHFNKKNPLPPLPKI